MWPKEKTLNDTWVREGVGLQLVSRNIWTNQDSPLLLPPPCCWILILIVVPWHSGKNNKLSQYQHLHDHPSLSVSKCFGHSLMVSGLRGRGWGGSRPWGHQQLPEVIIGQFGPKETHKIILLYPCKHIISCPSEVYDDFALIGGMGPSCEEPTVDPWRTKLLVIPVSVQGAAWTLQRTMNIWESLETINWTGWI